MCHLHESVPVFMISAINWPQMVVWALSTKLYSKARKETETLLTLDPQVSLLAKPPCGCPHKPLARLLSWESETTNNS